jgi:hypothetical protein
VARSRSFEPCGHRRIGERTALVGRDVRATGGEETEQGETGKQESHGVFVLVDET